MALYLQAILLEFDFAYVDGAHFFDAVKHDFYSIISQVNNEFGILFDDYVNRPYYGIKKLIDEEVSKNFNDLKHSRQFL